MDLLKLAAIGVWKFHFYDPKDFRYEQVVIGAQGVYELDRFIELMTKHPRADVRLATDILGIVAGQGGSGWKPCNLETVRFLRSSFVAKYGMVHEIPDYEPLEELV